MNLFSSSPQCVKCGGLFPNTAYRAKGSFSDEYLKLNCQTCNYEWYTHTRDYVEPTKENPA